MDPIMCANGCGFFGSAENRNLCSKCYNDFLKSEIIAKTVLSGVESGSIAAEKDAAVSELTASMEGLSVEIENVKKRCKKCNKKVGLTGFKCRCDGLFCARHRLPEEHSCDSDYKTYNPCDAQGNPRLPLIKADKLKWRA